MRGMFCSGPLSIVKFTDISDGTSNTVLYAEVRRGAGTGPDPYDVTKLSSGWTVLPAAPNAFQVNTQNTDPLSNSTFQTAC